MKKYILLITALFCFTINAQTVISNAVYNTLTETEILALTGKTPGDTYTSTDTNLVYTIAANGTAFLDENKDVVYVTTNNSLTENEPAHTITQASGITTIDARASKYQGLEVGGSNGVHRYTFQGQKNTVDLLGSTTPATLNAGTNVNISSGVVSKNITGNTWNASAYSTESFDPNVMDFAVTVEVESTTGTIREMIGLDDNPTQNNSYTSLDFAISQVNNYFYSRVYENGAATVIPNYTTFYFQVGDKIGVKCINGYVTYFVLRGTTVTDIYTSLKKATTPLYFKTALNRGNASSGASAVGNIEFYTSQKIDTYSLSIEGNSISSISDNDKDNLKNNAGIEFLSGSTYSLFDFTRTNSIRFGNGLLPIDLTHVYRGLDNNIQTTITF